MGLVKVTLSLVCVLPYNKISATLEVPPLLLNFFLVALSLLDHDLGHLDILHQPPEAAHSAQFLRAVP